MGDERTGTGEGELPVTVALGPDDRAALLRIARAALEAAVRGVGSTETSLSLPAPRSGGAFVSLHARDGALRGCVGLLRCEEPLHETVARMAVAAGTQDGRFAPVQASELDELVIEISALGVLRPIRPDEVEVGRDGLLIRAHGHSGVLLPQIAVHYQWSREEFLRKTAGKAGLPDDAWEGEEVELFAFTAEVFGEAPSGHAPSGPGGR
jgi:AmmeMemoRadiSam system protein A